MLEQRAKLLVDCVAGERGRISGLAAGLMHRSKFLAMGLLPGTEFTVEQVAPLGDPLVIRLRGLTITLRRQEALMFQVEML
ncbi:MAG: FeoA domain-containing protein [Pseudomonadota bacterium]